MQTIRSSLCRCNFIKKQLIILRSSSSSNQSIADQQKQLEADITIVGGGPIGLAIACGLANHSQVNPQSICLLDSGQLSDTWNELPVGCYSNRVVALSCSSVQQLQALNCWPGNDNARICPVDGMRIFESDSSACLSFDSDDYRFAFDPKNSININDNNNNSNTSMAYIVELGPIVSKLTQLAKQLDITLLSNSKLIGLDGNHSSTSSSRVKAKLSNGSTISTKLLIGCDGYQSPVRTLAAINCASINYGARAIVATVQLAGCHGNVAYQRFLTNGLIAVLPLGDNGQHASIVWCLTDQHYHRAAAYSDDEFVAELNRLLADEPRPDPPLRPGLPVISGVQSNSRASFPLGFMHADNYTKGRVVLAGDAAHRISPLAGLGANLGLEDAKCLVRLVTEAISNGADPADASYLRSYETERQRQALPVIAVNESLRLLYSLDANCALTAPLRLARSVGFRLTNRIGPLRHWLQRSATTGQIRLWPFS